MDYCWLEPERQEHRVRPADQELPQDAVINGWARALDVRAHLPEGFSRRTAALAAHLAQALGLDEAATSELRYGALLHDIGMMHVPDSIIRKPGPLSPGEWAVVRLHPVFAEEVLAPITALQAIAVIPRFHHERWDGSGYPYGLRGEQIPLAARIFAVADTWSAMTADRPYRRALAQEQALKHIADNAGAAFDPAVVDALLAALDQRVHAA